MTKIYSEKPNKNKVHLLFYFATCWLQENIYPKQSTNWEKQSTNQNFYFILLKTCWFQENIYPKQSTNWENTTIKKRRPKSNKTCFLKKTKQPVF